ncbi:hypothetical protein PIROE2DRAFT_1139 [Piromyces sp. E2]|nr:hypothetical protein PIROE2DRAFT_1139 [Piromyces sp. E2]|eukprot:OUM70613.1 hypothetical protein PIROE2DRAFT_1139 [Piromyces sp. E2]
MTSLKRLPPSLFGIRNVKAFGIDNCPNLKVNLINFPSKIKYCNLQNTILSCYQPGTCENINVNGQKGQYISETEYLKNGVKICTEEEINSIKQGIFSSSLTNSDSVSYSNSGSGSGSGSVSNPDPDPDSDSDSDSDSNPIILYYIGITAGFIINICLIGYMSYNMKKKDSDSKNIVRKDTSNDTVCQEQKSTSPLITVPSSSEGNDPKYPKIT